MVIFLGLNFKIGNKPINFEFPKNWHSKIILFILKPRISRWISLFLFNRQLSVGHTMAMFFSFSNVIFKLLWNFHYSSSLLIATNNLSLPTNPRSRVDQSIEKFQLSFPPPYFEFNTQTLQKWTYNYHKSEYNNRFNNHVYVNRT